MERLYRTYEGLKPTTRIRRWRACRRLYRTYEGLKQNMRAGVVTAAPGLYRTYEGLKLPCKQTFGGVPWLSLYRTYEGLKLNLRIKPRGLHRRFVSYL